MSRSPNGSGRPADRSGFDPSTSLNHSVGPIMVIGTASVWPIPLVQHIAEHLAGEQRGVVGDRRATDLQHLQVDPVAIGDAGLAGRWR